MSPGLYRCFGKRVLDLILGFIIFMISLPLMILIGIMIKLDSEGAIVFKQTRIGKGGKPFIMYKFRTMREGSERHLQKYIKLNIADEPAVKIPNDPRFTRIGSVLSKTALDELPQLVNVLKGEMSLVGPRPPIDSEVRQYKSWYKKRFEIKPGITSPWVLGGMHKMKFCDWMKSDINYIKQCSLLLDLKILVGTALKIVRLR